jgi:orotate phosphoribosyltransferase
MNAREHLYVTGAELQEYRDKLKQVILEKSLLRGEFILASGKKSNYYLDLRLTTLSPEGCHLVGETIYEMLKDAGIQAVGGPTLGADPMVAAVTGASFRHGNPIPAFIVRKATKDHGTGKLIEGMEIKGLDVAIIEDVVTKGGSVEHAIRSAIESGARVKKVICIVDRLQGGEANLKALGTKLGQDFAYDPVFTIRDLGIEPDPS